MAQASIDSLRKKEGRGILLTSLIVLGVLAKFYYFPKSLNQLINEYGIGDTLFVLGDAVIFWIILYFIWKWKKKGIYALFLYFGLYICFFTYLQLTASEQIDAGGFWFIFIIFALLASLVWYFVLKRKLHLFT